MADPKKRQFCVCWLFHEHCFVFDYNLTRDQWDKVRTLLLLRVALLAACLSPVYVLLCLLIPIFDSVVIFPEILAL